MRFRRVYIAYAIVAGCLWPLPLLNVLHVESSAVVAAAAFFVSGWTACGTFDRRTTLRQWLRITGHLLVPLVVPWGMLTVSMLWAPNCGYVQGLGLFLLFVPVSAVLGTAAAYALTATKSADGSAPGVRRRGWLMAAGLVVMVAGPVFDYAFHPQFFSYNHVFGGILGPIYDEQLAIRPGLFWFRGMTVLWAVLLVALGLRRRGWGGRVATAALPVSALLLGVAYVFSTTLGFNVTEASLMRALPGTLQTEHFEIHYDPTAHSPEEVASWGGMQEVAYAELSRRLHADPAKEERFLTFVYPSPREKARLTGARTTSVAPVWLGRAQSHLLVSRLEASFQHELAHLFSRPYGLPGLRASWSVGLVEGWAVALEPSDARPTPDDMVRVARGRLGLGEDLSAAVEARLSPFGFWTDRGAVSYTTMGSFVSYLLRAYGPERLKDVYALADFEDVYGRPLKTLTQEWARSLDRETNVHAEAGRSVTRQFSQLSLFETPCPHFVPRYRRLLQRGQEGLAAQDTSSAERAFRLALQAEPRSASAHVHLARIRLAADSAETVLQQLGNLAKEWHTPSVGVIRADALARLGKPDSARVLYRSVLSGLPVYRDDVWTELALRYLSSSRPELIRVWTSRAPAADQAERFDALASEIADRGSAASDPAAVLASVWAARRWSEAHRPEQATAAWSRAHLRVTLDAQRRLADTTRNKVALDERGDTSLTTPRRLRDAERLVQTLVSKRKGDAPSAAWTDPGEKVPRAWRVRLARSLAEATFDAELRSATEERHAKERHAEEAALIAKHLEAAGAIPLARVWSRLKDVALDRAEWEGSDEYEWSVRSR